MLQPRLRKTRTLRQHRLKFKKKYNIYIRRRRRFSKLRYKRHDSCAKCALNLEKVMVLLANNPEIKTELKATNSINIILQTRLERCTMQIKQLTQEKAQLQEIIKKHKRTEVKLNQALEEAQSHYDKALTQKELEGEKSLSRMKENYENMIKVQDEKKTGFTKAMQWVHEMLTQFIKLQLKMAEDDKARLQKSVNELELTVLNQARTIGDLQNQLGESDVVQLKKHVAQLEELMLTKNLELSVAKRAEKGTFSNLCEEKEEHAKTLLKLEELTDVNARLESEIREANSRFQDTEEELQKSKGQHADLSENNKRLKRRLKATKLNNASLRSKVKELERFRLRVTRDLQRCTSLIKEPKTLAKRVLALKELYVDPQKNAKAGEETNAASKRPADRVTTRTSEMTKKEKQPREASELGDETRRFFIKLVNEKILEVHRLRRELKQAHVQLKKATKPAPQKIKLWIDRKLCRSARVTPDLADEPPALYPEDWQPPDLDLT